MTYSELNFFHKKLLEQKEAEAKAQEEALKNVETSRRSVPKFRPARKRR